MKIAIVTELFSPSLGGQEVRYLELGAHLAKAGHSVDVYTIRFRNDLPQEENTGSISVHRITDGFRFKSLSSMSRNPVDVVGFTLDLLRIRKQLASFDVVVFNKWPILPALVLPRIPRFPKSVIDWCEIRDSPVWKLVYGMMANPTALHIGVSTEICTHLAEKFSIPAEHITPILSGIDSDLYRCERPDKKDRVIVFFGRMAAHKNPFLALESFVRGQLSEKGYALHMMGGGPLLESIERAASSCPKVFVHGAVDDELKIQLLKEASLLILPSRREGFPRVVAEAAAAGTPTLTADFQGNGTVSVVKEYGIGWVCPPVISELGAAMERYARKSGEWDRVSRTCVDRAVDSFDWNVLTAELLSFLGVTS